jgi:transcriptional regulator GlxA family with amidase domain
MPKIHPNPVAVHPPPKPESPKEPDPILVKPRPKHAALLHALERALNDALTSDLGPLAKQLGLSKRSLQRVLAGAGVAFHDLRDRLRLRRAEAILADASVKVSAVANEVGFTSNAHFSAWFRRHHGLTPGAWRDRQSAVRDGLPESDNP